MDDTKESQTTLPKLLQETRGKFLLFVEAVISIVQVVSGLILTGDFERSVVVRVTGGLFVELEPNTTSVLQSTVFVASFPETAYFNVTIFTIVVSMLILMSMLTSVLETLERHFTYVILYTLNAVVMFLIVFGLLFELTGREEAKIGLYALIVGISGPLVLIACFACYVKLNKSRSISAEMLRVETVSVIIFFQVFDLVKDAVFLIVAPTEPLILAVTIVDVVLSFFALYSLYQRELAENYALLDFAATVVQYLLYCSVLCFVSVVIIFLVYQAAFGVSVCFAGATPYVGSVLVGRAENRETEEATTLPINNDYEL